MVNEEEKKLLKKYNETVQDLLEDIYCDEISFLNYLMDNLGRENGGVAKSLVNKIHNLIDKGNITEYKKNNKIYYKISNI